MVFAGAAILKPPPMHRSGPASAMAPDSRAPSVPIDDVDRALVQQLLADSKTTNRDLAKILHISESAVSLRIRKLMSSGALVFTAIIDSERAGFEWWVICLIKTRKRSAIEVANDVRDLAQCASAAVALGSHDVVAYLTIRDREELRSVIDQLGCIQGVADLHIELATDTRVSPLGRQLFLAIDPAPVRLPAPCIDLDDLDVSILQELIDDGRQSSRSIARKFGVSEGTVRARTSRMTGSGLVQVVAMFDPVVFGLAGLLATVMIRADRSRIEPMVKEFMAMPNVAFIAVCVGGWDLHVAVLTADHSELMEFVDTTVQGIDGVRATETLLFVDIVRFSPCLNRVTGLWSVA